MTMNVHCANISIYHHRHHHHHSLSHTTMQYTTLKTNGDRKVQLKHAGACSKHMSYTDSKTDSNQTLTASLSRRRPQAAIGRTCSQSPCCGRMMLRAVVPCDAALCNLQAVDCTLPALIACPIPSVYQRPCPPAYLGGVDRPNTGRNPHHCPNLFSDQEAGPGAGGFQQPMTKMPMRQAMKPS